MLAHSGSSQRSNKHSDYILRKTTILSVGSVHCALKVFSNCISSRRLITRTLRSSLTRFASSLCVRFLQRSPKWVLQGKKIAAQKIIGKYLQFPGGDFFTPLS
jgi:hypothetical protein